MYERVGGDGVVRKWMGSYFPIPLTLSLSPGEDLYKNPPWGRGDLLNNVISVNIYG